MALLEVHRGRGHLAHLVIIRRGDEGSSVVGEMKVIDIVLVVLEHLPDPHGPDDVVDQLHGGRSKPLFFQFKL